MKRILLIVAAVGGYALLEAALLLGVIVPRESGFSLPVYGIVVAWGQFLLIPVLAALVSRVVYGPQKWGRRALLILLAGPLVIFLVITPFIVLAIMIDWTFIVSKIIVAAAMTAVYVAMVMGLRWCLRKSREWNIEAEAARWLAGRQVGTHQPKWANRGIRVAVCLPVMLVLLIFLFLPETWEIFSRLVRPKLGDLSGYRVAIPVTWIVQYHYFREDSNGRSSIGGLAARGIGLGGNPFRYDSLAFWEIATKSFSRSETTDYHRWPPKEEDIIEHREFLISSERLQCVDYRYRYRNGSVEDSTTLAHVSCSGSTRLIAGFDGPRTQLPAFWLAVPD